MKRESAVRKKRKKKTDGDKERKRKRGREKEKETMREIESEMGRERKLAIVFFCKIGNQKFRDLDKQ